MPIDALSVDEKDLSSKHEAAAVAPLGSSPLAAVVGADLSVPLVTGSKTTYVNLDYAASAPALQSVADELVAALPFYSSVHRGAGYASAVSTAAYEAARMAIGSFVGARVEDVVIITRNTTDALNLLATAVPGAVVHLDIEHHANFCPGRHAADAWWLPGRRWRPRWTRSRPSWRANRRRCCR